MIIFWVLYEISGYIFIDITSEKIIKTLQHKGDHSQGIVLKNLWKAPKSLNQESI